MFMFGLQCPFFVNSVKAGNVRIVGSRVSMQHTHLFALFVTSGLGPWTLYPGPWALDPGPWTLDLGPWPLDPGPWTLDPRPSTLDPQPSTLDPRPWTLDPRPWTLDPRPSTLDPRLHILSSVGNAWLFPATCCLVFWEDPLCRC